MRIPRTPHRWSVTTRQAIAIQQRMAQRVVQRAASGRIRYVAGTDLAFSRDGLTCIAAAVIWDLEAEELVEQRSARQPVRFPYVPGLLSFREAPAVLCALRKLRQVPDALMCDGQGFAHPRRFGLACHLGVITGLPTVGCAKSRLVGTHAEPKARRGASAALVDGDETIGAVVRTRDNVKCVYVSVGNRISLAEAVRLVLACAPRYRLPEPTRLADRLVARLKREAKHV